MTRLLLWLLCALLIGIVTAAEINEGTDSDTDSNVETSSFAESKSNSAQNETSSVVECKEPDAIDVSDTTNEDPTTTTTEPSELTCGSNEVVDNCPADCQSDRCPRSEAESKAPSCLTSEVCPPPQCKCQFNYRRADNGTCIPTSSCPPFKCRGVNEEYNSCPPYCPSDDCSQATPDGSCPKRFGRIGIRLICSPKCRCRKGFCRKNGICRPYADCNKLCPLPNEVYMKEKPSCPPQECFALVARINCADAPPPAPGCGCKPGFLRLKSNSSCMPQCQCPEIKNTPECMEQTDYQ